MNKKSEDFIAGAVASFSKRIQVSKLATGELPPVLFHWFHIRDTENDECFVVLMGDEETETAIASKECCAVGDKKSVTMALIKTMRLGGRDDDFEAFFCALEPGWVNSKFIDASVLRASLEKGAANLEPTFDFDEWAIGHGFGPTRKSSGKGISPSK